MKEIEMRRLAEILEAKLSMEEDHKIWIAGREDLFSQQQAQLEQQVERQQWMIQELQKSQSLNIQQTVPRQHTTQS